MSVPGHHGLPLDDFHSIPRAMYKHRTNPAQQRGACICRERTLAQPSLHQSHDRKVAMMLEAVILA